MPYTDARGRPELVADPQLKRGAAAWRVVAPDELTADAAEEAAGMAGVAAAQPQP